MKAADLAAGSVDGAKVADGSLSGADFGGSLGGSDSGAQILGKLAQVDGSGSGLDADSVDGLGSGALLQGGSAAGRDLTGAYPNPQIAGNAVGSAEVANGTLSDADLAPRESVVEPTLASCDGVSNWDSGPAIALDAGYWKDRSGVVRLQGSVGCSAGNATEGGVIFTLPGGYTPSGPGGGAVRWAALAGGVTIAQIAVLNNGQVVYDGPNSDTADNYISLDGLSFRAED